MGMGAMLMEIWQLDIIKTVLLFLGHSPVCVDKFNAVSVAALTIFSLKCHLNVEMFVTIEE